jgi:arylamine N-acetyltransferase
LTSTAVEVLGLGEGRYCFEHVTLFAAVLERRGFGLTGLAARVRTGTGQPRPTTHALLLVRAAHYVSTHPRSSGG